MKGSTMPRQRKTARKERKRQVKVQFIPRPPKARKPPDPLDPYGYLDRLVMAHHEPLADAKIALAWLLDVKPDCDGHLTLGRCRKATDLDREFREFDLVILLNAAAWRTLNEQQRAALVDHELCHATIAQDKHGEPILDERDRKCYRLRKHDIEEFHAVVKRHGVYLSDIAEFIRSAEQAPLFAPRGNGEAQ
jgi:hypothetical protein